MALSAKIAAHELGHLVGLLHQDSFGPIGYGPHAPPGGGSYNPDYPGPAAGFAQQDAAHREWQPADEDRVPLRDVQLSEQFRAHDGALAAQQLVRIGHAPIQFERAIEGKAWLHRPQFDHPGDAPLPIRTHHRRGLDRGTALEDGLP